MFQPLEWFVGLRYLRSRRRRGVVSFMSTASLLGIALGVAALIIILSVMNGLETETRTRLLSVNAHATISSRAGIADWREWQARLADTPGVTGVAPYVNIEGMLAAGSSLKPALVRGIEPDAERHVSEIERQLVIGQPGRARARRAQDLARPLACAAARGQRRRHGHAARAPRERGARAAALRFVHRRGHLRGRDPGQRFRARVRRSARRERARRSERRRGRRRGAARESTRCRGVSRARGGRAAGRVPLLAIGPKTIATCSTRSTSRRR